MAFREALEPGFTDYQRKVLDNALILAGELDRLGLRLVSGGTDNHMVLVDLTETGVTGREAEEALRKADSELKVFEDQKQEIVKDIDARTLSKYDFIRKNRNGVAIAGVTKGLCTACHMNLPPQFFNELMKTDQLLTCPNCHRIIYWMDHEKLSPPQEDAAAGNE